ncbi:MAG: TrkA family potassium uptake protein [Gammaproteobacteria bacterium]
MNQVVWLVLRRMRQPFLVLICVYSISIMGMVLMPGVEQNGLATHMDFFHAIYFVSYTSTTIGFGEIPVAFSYAQRMWAMLCIYMSVVAWLYSIGSILTLIQDKAFRQALVERSFARGVRKIKEPFYLQCGYGEAGALLVKSLTNYNIQMVVLDRNQDRINALSLQDQKLPLHVPGLCADAEIPEHLLEAGLKHPLCARVIALTDSDRINLKIALTSKLLNPKVKVVASASSAETQANIASFGTEDVVDAFGIFAETIALALHSPDQYLLREWLSGISHRKFTKPRVPPRGKWIICGYGRLGHFLIQHLEDEDLPTVVIEVNDQIEPPPEGMIIGAGTEAHTLHEADVEGAVGIVAGTDDDLNNLSIIMTARELNPDLFVVARQNRESNTALFKELEADMILNPGQVLADKIRGLVTMPRLSEFFEHVSQYDNKWAKGLFNRLDELIGTEASPDIWVVKINQASAPAILDMLLYGNEMMIEHLLVHPYKRDKQLKAYPLFLIRGEERRLMPTVKTPLKPLDRILFCGADRAYHRMQLLINDRYLLEQVVLDQDIPRSTVLRWALERNK